MRRAAEERRPKVALLVDSPDFNLRLAKHLKRLGVKVVYYVSPMIWAWRRGRAHKIAKVVDRMLCILPFEERFYEGTGVSARFVGHPFAERALPGDAASPAADAARSPASCRPCSRPPSASRPCTLTSSS
jgi:lipid-A-disaccharide synthase